MDFVTNVYDAPAVDLLDIDDVQVPVYLWMDESDTSIDSIWNIDAELDI